MADSTELKFGWPDLLLAFGAALVVGIFLAKTDWF